MKVMKAAPIVGRVKEDIDRLFDRFFTTPFTNDPFFPTFETIEPATAWLPVFDLAENEKEYIVRL